MTDNETFIDKTTRLLSNRIFPIRITNTDKKIFFSKDEIIEYMIKRNAQITTERNGLIFLYDNEEHHTKNIPKRMRETYVYQRQ